MDRGKSNDSDVYGTGAKQKLAFCTFSITEAKV
jgi:hypothetical protein